jgi:hypothetical protein
MVTMNSPLFNVSSQKTNISYKVLREPNFKLIPVRRRRKEDDIGTRSHGNAISPVKMALIMSMMVSLNLVIKCIPSHIAQK